MFSTKTSSFFLIPLLKHLKFPILDDQNNRIVNCIFYAPLMLTVRQLPSDCFAKRIHEDEEVGNVNGSIAVEVKFLIEALMSALGSKYFDK